MTDDLVKLAVAVAANRRNTARECRETVQKAAIVTADMTATVSRLAGMQPADVAADPAGTLAMLRMVGAAALSAASGSMQVALHAATAFDMLADEGEKLAVYQIADIERAAAATMTQAVSAGPTLVVNNEGNAA